MVALYFSSSRRPTSVLIPSSIAGAAGAAGACWARSGSAAAPKTKQGRMNAANRRMNPPRRILSESDSVRFHHVGDEFLASLAGLRVVRSVVGDVVRKHADAEKGNVELRGDLGGGSGFHFFGRRSVALVKQLDAIEI